MNRRTTLCICQHDFEHHDNVTGCVECACTKFEHSELEHKGKSKKYLNKPLKTNEEIIEMSQILQTGLSVIPFKDFDEKLIIKVGQAEFKLKNEAGLLVFIPDSKNIWQKWLGDFYKKNCEIKDKNATK